MRAAYCDGGKDKGDANSWKVVVSERIEGAINLGDTAIRSLKEAGIPDGAAVQASQLLQSSGNAKYVANPQSLRLLSVT